MLFRFAGKDDFSALCTLWAEAFGDSPDYIESFYRTHFSPEFTAVCEMNGQVCAMANLLPCSLFSDGKKLPARYIYAVATLKSFRGRGIASDLMRFVCNFLEESNLCGFLSPAEKSLYEFYRPLGFTEAFAAKRLQLSPSNRPECSFEEISTDELLADRNSFFSDKGFVVWEKTQFSAFRRDMEADSAHFFKICSQNGHGYVVCYKLSSGWLITEAAANDELLKDAAAALGGAEVIVPCSALDENVFWNGMTFGQIFPKETPAWLGYDLQ